MVVIVWFSREPDLGSESWSDRRIHCGHTSWRAAFVITDSMNSPANSRSSVMTSIVGCRRGSITTLSAVSSMESGSPTMMNQSTITRLRFLMSSLREETILIESTSASVTTTNSFIFSATKRSTTTRAFSAQVLPSFRFITFAVSKKVELRSPPSLNSWKL